jgi:hypothetical protein
MPAPKGRTAYVRPVVTSVGQGGGDGRALVKALGALGLRLYRINPGELLVTQLVVPALLLTVLGGLVNGAVGGVFAVLWGVVLVVSVTARMSGSAMPGSSESVAIGGCYWSVLGLVCCAPGDAIAAVVAAFLLWTSARPGREWLPWPRFYQRLMRRSHGFLDRIAVAPVFVVPVAALVGTVILWPIPDVDKGFGWFAGFGLAALLLLVVTTAGAEAPVTRALARVALVLSCFSLASISQLRPSLLVVCILLGLVTWALEHHPAAIGQAS